jgi:hypothetical protein
MLGADAGQIPGLARIQAGPPDEEEGMSHSNAAVFLTLAAACGLPAALAAPGDGFVTYRGMATELATRQPLYSEEHFLRYRDGQIAQRVVLYQCADGRPFARKQVEYVDRFAPDFDTVDVSRGLHEGLRSASGQREVFYRETMSDTEVTKRLPRTQEMVADAGFDEFVRAHWDLLLSGQSKELDFLVPSRLGVHEFRVSHVRASVTDGTLSQVFRLRLSGLLGFVLPAIEVHYSDSQRTLLRYEGLSNLQDADGNHYKARIVFPSQYRHSSDAAALRTAQEAPLRPCG